MIRAYDEYGNIIDIVEWEKKIRKTAIGDFAKMAYDELLYNEHLTEIDINYIAEQLKAGVSNEYGSGKVCRLSD